MNRVKYLRAFCAVVVLLAAVPSFAAPYTSNGTGGGDWGNASTWTPNGVPIAGDTVTIAGGDTVTVTGLETINAVDLDTSGNNTLRVVSGGSLAIQGAGNVLTLMEASFGTNLVELDGGSITTTFGSVDLQGGAGSFAEIRFTANGGSFTVADTIFFSGLNSANGRIICNGASIINIGGDLGSGGTINAGSNSNFTFNGNAGQTVGAVYTFDDFTVNKASGTATLAGPITVDGNLAVTSGILDDGGQQISLNAGLTSLVTMGGNGVLKLGDSTTATSFPSPVSPANVTFSPNSAVSYHAGVPQSVDAGITYRRLYIQTVGPAVTHTVSGSVLSVMESLNVLDNGLNGVTLQINTSLLDVDGDIAGDGTVSATNTGAIAVGGHWGAAVDFSFTGSTTVTYDGSAAQSVRGTTYHDLVINKPSGIASLGATTTVNNDLSIVAGTLDTNAMSVTVSGNLTNTGSFAITANTVSLAGDFTNSGSFNGGSGIAKLALTGTSIQTIGGTSIPIFNLLQVSNTAGVTLTQSIQTNDLTITAAGNITTGANVVNILSGGTASTVSGWVVGNLHMSPSSGVTTIYHVGTAGSYTPVDVTLTGSGSLMVSTIAGAPSGTTGPNVLGHHWLLSNGAGFTTADLLFHWNAGDVTGAESSYVLRSSDGASWTDYGDVDETNHHGDASSLPAVAVNQYWTAGTPGSLGSASKLAITSVNGGTSPVANVAFDVDVETQSDDGNPANVTGNTGVQLSVTSGTGTLGGTTTGTITAGANSLTISGVTYNTAEAGVVLEASRTSGDVLSAGSSAAFTVTGGASTITVSSINDAGAGTLREAITTANAGGCTDPCTIDFSTAGTIVLQSALPAITDDNLTIDGFTAPGASANTAAFGQPSDAVITVGIDGSNGISIGLDIQETFVKIKGLAVMNFDAGGTGIGIRLSGDNSGSNVSGCYIGTDMTGTLGAPNGTGVFFDNSTESSVGGLSPAARNVISGQSLTGTGIVVSGTSNTVGIIGNYVGVKADLTGALPNFVGVNVLNGTSSVSIGAGGVGNVVSGNSHIGIAVDANGTTLAANIVGPAGDSLIVLPNVNGIFVSADAVNTTVGGPSPSDTNTVSGNGFGIVLYADGVTVDNNVIGIAPDGTSAMGNTSAGVLLAGAASNNIIGSTFGNTIANNEIGIASDAAHTGTGNVFRQNKIYSSTNLGIDLVSDGVTGNDPTDIDTGSNNLQNFPVITDASYSGGTTIVKLSLDSSAGVATNFFQFDLYKGDTSATTQAANWLGSSGCVAGNVFTNFTFGVTSGSVTIGDKIVATATAYSDAACSTPSEGTSEFSAAAAIGGDIHWIAGSGTWETAANWDPAIVPTAAADAFIDAPGTYTVTINSVAAANSITLGVAGGLQTLGLTTGNSLTVNSPSTVTANGVLSVTSATLGGTGSLTVYGALNWGSGDISGLASLDLESGATMTLNGSAGRTLSQRLLTVKNGATLTWNGGQLNLFNGAGIDNYGTFEAMGAANLNDAGSDAGFDNFGTFRKSADAGTVTFTNVDFNHMAGTVEVDMGTLDLGDGQAQSAFTIDPGAELLINSDTYNFANSTTVSGTGTLRVSNNSTLEITGASVPVERLTLDDGWISGSGMLTTGSTGVFTFTGGTMNVSAVLIDDGGTLAISGTATKNLSTAVTIDPTGVVTVDSTGSFNASNISNAGLFELKSDTTVGGTFTNTGTLRRSTSAGTALFGGTLSNSGTIDVDSGTLELRNGSSSGPLSIDGTLLFTGSFPMNFTITGGSITGTGLLQVNTGTLTVNANIHVPNLQIDDGALAGSGMVTVDSMAWNGGTMEGTGTTKIVGNGDLTIAGAVDKILNGSRTLIVEALATGTCCGTARVYFNPGTSIVNAGLFELTGAAPFEDFGGDGLVSNSGTLRATGTATAEINNVDINNIGTLDIVAGTLDVANVNSGGTIQANGTLLVNSDVVTLTGGTVTGTGLVSIAGGTLTANTNISIPQFSFSSGNVNGSGILTLSNTADWSGGSMDTAGSTVIPNGVTLTVSGSTLKELDNRTLTIDTGATLDMTGDGPIISSNAAAIVNNGTVRFNAAGNFSGSGGGSFTNSGTVEKIVSNDVFITVPTTNHGLLDVRSGLLYATATPFIQSASGTLKLHLGGTTVGTGYSQLLLDSNPTLAGTLQIALVGAYEPAGGDTFQPVFILNGTHTGDFSAYTYPPLSGGRTFSNSYDANGVLLTVSGGADLTIVKTAPTNVVMGGPIAYTLTVNNAGPTLASSVSVSDTLPAGHTNISASGTGWTCNVVTDTVTCTANSSLAAGNAPDIIINADAPAVAQTMTNTATVSSSNDSNNTNDSGSAVVVIDGAGADIWLGGSSPAGPVPGGTAVAFLFGVGNDGPQQATGVVFTAGLPAGLTFNSASIGASACGISGQTVTCPSVIISPFSSVTATINVTANATGTQIVNAGVAGLETDPDPVDNTLSQQVQVSGSVITVDNTNDSGSGSLRQALLDALFGTCTLNCTIAFNLPAPYRIQPLTDLPDVASTTVVDATTQPGYTGTPLVEIDASLIGSSYATFVVHDDVTIRGFSLTNGNHGITLDGDNNVIEGNYIGLTPAGVVAANDNGIRVNGDGNTIGGTTAAQRNVISGNSSAGVFIDGAKNNTVISGNYIGTDPTGTLARPNDIGIHIEGDASGTTIGGATAAHRNIISGNTSYGVYVAGTGVVVGIARNERGVASQSTAASVAANTTIRNNWIGPDVNGTASFSSLAGIALLGNVSDATISDNVLSGLADGIKTTQDTVTGTKISNNLIGVRPDGTTPMGNSANGISLSDAVDTAVGGTTALGNVIGNNGGAGVIITGANALGNTVLGNSIFNSTGLGIDLGTTGVNANDAGDTDLGPNGIQNFPVLGSAQLAGGNLNVAFTLDSFGGSTLVELFKADSVASGEGMTFLGGQCYAGGALNTTLSIPGAPVANGNGIVATATSYSDATCNTVLGGTSEFSAAATVSACTPPAATLTAPASVCASSTGNGASVNAPAATSWFWTISGGSIATGQGTAAITFNAASSGSVTLTVTVTDGIGCTNTASSTFPITTPPAIGIAGPASACGSASLTASGGFTSYSWSHGPTSAAISVTTSGTYTVTGTDSNGCTATTSHNITVTPATTPTITTSGSTTFCTGGSVVLTSSAAPSYAWSTGETTQSITVNNGGSYTVTTTGGACTATSAPTTVTVNPTPVISITGPTNACASAALTASPGFTSYTWSHGPTGQNVTVTTSGTYTVTGIDANGCSASASHTITVTPGTTPTITASGPTTFCAGGSVILTSSAAPSYAWSTGETTQSITVNTGGSYTVTTTDGACTVTSAPTTVTVNPTPVISITGPTSACASAALTASAGFTSYTWSHGPTGQNVTVTTSGSYTVTGIDANGCSASASHNVTVTPGTTPTITASGPTTFCAGGSVTLTSSAAPSYAWSTGETTQSITVTTGGSYTVTTTDGACTVTSAPTTVTVNPTPVISITGPATACASATLTASAGFTSYTWSHGPTGQNVTVTTSGTYTVTGTDSNGCTATTSHTITVTPGTTPTITASGPTTFCAGGSVTLTSSAAPSYAWSTGETTQSITVSTGGSYTVTTTDGACTATSAPVTVTVNPTPVISITGPTNACASAALSASAGFTSYTWSHGPTGQNVTVTTSGTYTVTGIDANGCSASASHTITVTPGTAPTITASGSTAFCDGGSVTLTSSPATSYAWSSGETTQSITVTAGGTFTVTTTNGACTSTSAPTTVTEHPPTTVTITGNVDACGDGTLDAGPGFVSYLWSTGETSQTIAIGNATSYSVTVTGANGCTATDSYTVPAPPPQVAPQIIGPTSFCDGSSVTLATNYPGQSYLWSTGATTPSIVVTNSGTYTVTITTSCGTLVPPPKTVTVKPVPAATITGPSSVNENATGLAASVTATAGATYAWTVVNGSITSGQGTNAITFTAGSAGSMSLNVNVTLDGCSAGDVHNITVNGPTGQSANVSIVKTAPPTVQAGAPLTYSIVVANAGPSTAPSVVVSDTLPAGTTLASMSGGAFQCSALPAGVFCNGSLAANASNTITLTVTAPQQGGTITNTASVDGGVADPQPDDNASSATTVVTGGDTGCATTPPSLVAPASGASVNSPVVLSWSAVDGAAEYELWIDQSLAAVTNALSRTQPLSSGNHQWYVVARFATNCTPLVSATRTFTVTTTGNCGSHVAPVLNTPSGGVVGSPVAFSWTPVPQAIGYRVWIEVNGTAAQEAGSTNGAISLVAAVPPGAIVAYVDALFSGCPVTRSTPVTFTVAAPDPCAGRGTPATLLPANDATVNSSSLELQWSAAHDADGYRVWASIDGAAPAVLGETGGELSLRVNVGHGRVEWWVNALYEGCASTESQHAVFTIPRRNDCAGPAPNAISPSNVIETSTDVTFNWTPVPQAVSYEVWLSVNSGTPTLIGTTTATSLTEVIAPGRISWYVVAIVGGCPSRQSQTVSFVYETPAACAGNVRPQAIAPLANARVTSPVSFAWTAPQGALSYELFIVRNGQTTRVASTTSNSAPDVNLDPGKVRWYVRAFFDGACSLLDSPEQKLEVVAPPVACTELAPPQVTAIGQISSGVPFLIQWNEIPGATSYQLQLASNPSFADAEVISTGNTQHALVRTNNGDAPLAVYARVRAIDARCTPEPTVTPFGPFAGVFILPVIGSEAAAPATGGIIVQQIVLGPELAGQSFVATVKEPWLSVSPSSGVIAAGGTTLTVTANATSLPLGTSLGAVRITLNSSARGVGTHATKLNVSTISVGKVTPVTPTPKTAPPPDALIIPAVAHADGINSRFQSDVRVTNSSAQSINYQVSFTPSGGAGITTGKQTQFSIDPGRTIALDDVLKSWFGTGGESVTGTLEVRPLTKTSASTSSNALSGLPNLVTFASSRTFNLTSNGTFGQYIPAIPFANFIGKGTDLAKPAILSLQQIAQSARYRTNLGIVEGSGDAVNLMVKVFGNNGAKLSEFPVNLAGGQHTQLNSFLVAQGVGPVTDGRIEVSVVGGSGKVTAYASVLDNDTSDPLLVTPVTLTDAGTTRWVMPGVADLDNGTANWQTDMRVFNAGTTDVETTLTFYSQNGGEPKTANITIPAGQVKQFDRTLASVFGAANDGGAVHITTAASARLIATARTYNQTNTGTYGQFISAVTTNEAAGVGNRPLQLLQVEESDRFRSNIGLAEVTGNPVKLELSIVPPDAKFTIVTELTLQANEFRQLNALLRSAGLGETYNARVTVRAIEGTGRVTAYASVIDMLTNDPTYVPAQ